MLGRIVVVGASLAGLRAVEALRDQGFDGAVTLVGDERHLPYDRPPLSKQVLQGAWPPERAFFRQKEGYGGLAVDLRLGVRAVALDLSARRVALSDGTSAPFDRLIIATGARVRLLPGLRGRQGLHGLRTLDDAMALAGELPSARRVLIVGAGFIGLEVAASCRARGVDVTMVDAARLPLATVCGEACGQLVAALHRDHGVDLRLGVTVQEVEGDARVTGVRLSDGTHVTADAVVVGVGVTPNTEWLEGSGLTIEDGVVCDGSGAAAEHVYAAGDVARMHNAWVGGTRRVEHWTSAVEQAAFVAASALGGSAGRVFSSVPYFWSDQYDRKIQFVGDARAHDETVVVEGSLAERRLTMLFRRGERLCACLAVNQPRALVKYRGLLAARARWADAIS